MQCSEGVGECVAVQEKVKLSSDGHKTSDLHYGLQQRRNVTQAKKVLLGGVQRGLKA